ncbi:MAG: methyl-coenzyme M reductase glutamine C-methyltransferase [Methanoregula sp.]|jgi:B12-binding domain/radical SAM domain protein
MNYTVISPGIYTYGAMLIAGTIRHSGKPVALHKDLVAERGDTVYLSLYSTLHLLDPAIRDFVGRVRKTGGICYVGGPVSAYPEIVLGELNPDAVILGEGEVTVRHLVAGAKIHNTEGVAYRSGQKIVIRKRDPPESIEHPLPLIPADIGTQSIRGASAYIESHRGCSGACTFCQVPRFFGHAIRSREIPAIVAEVEAFKKAGARRIAISGGTGSLYQADNGRINPDAFVALLSGLSGVMGSANVSSPDIRVDCITDEILDAIKKYTIGWVFFGIESGSDAVLTKMGKGVSVAQVTDAIRRCREHGLKVAGSFIVGYPTETAADYEKTKEFIAEQELDDIFISIAEPIPSTPLAALVLKTSRDQNPVFIPTTGEYKPLGLTEAEARCFDLMLHADLCKPVLHVTTDALYDTYLAEAKKQGREIRAVTELLFRYKTEDPHLPEEVSGDTVK